LARSPHYRDGDVAYQYRAKHRLHQGAIWNYRHIVRVDKMKAYNQVNLLNGYGLLTIISPKEVRFDDEEL